MERQNDIIRCHHTGVAKGQGNISLCPCRQINPAKNQNHRVPEVRFYLFFRVALGKFLEEFVYLAVEICHGAHCASATPSFQVGKNFENRTKNIKDAVVLGWAGRFWKTRAKQWESQR